MSQQGMLQKNAAVVSLSWVSNLNPEDNWNVCEQCQVDGFGGWPDGYEKKDSGGSTIV